MNAPGRNVLSDDSVMIQSLLGILDDELDDVNQITSCPRLNVTAIQSASSVQNTDFQTPYLFNVVQI